MVRGTRVAVVAWLATGLLIHCGSSSDPPPEADAPLPPRTSTTDGDIDGSLPIPDAGEHCDPAAPFGAAQLVPGLDQAVFYATPRLSPDELAIYFTTITPFDGAPQTDLMRAVRASRELPFEPAKALAVLDSPQDDNDPTVGADNRSLWFSSARTGNHQLYVARRAAVTDEFTTAALVPGLSGPSQDMNAYYRAAGPELWFVSDRSDSGSLDIYVAPERDGAFGPAKVVSELSSPAGEAHPQLAEDGLHVLLASNRDGGAGGYDLWLATRASTTVPFGAPTPLASVNTTSDEYGGWISPDGCRVYFSSNRDTEAQPHHRLWFATRTK